MSQDQTSSTDQTVSPSGPQTTSGPDQTDQNKVNDDEHRYACPFCNAVYDHEILTRTHVTRSEDADHLNHDGFMPETKIHVLDQNDEVVEKLSCRPRDIDPETLGIDDLPDEETDQHKHIILCGAHNPYTDNYTTLETQATERLKQQNIDTVSYSTVRRIIRDFYRPNQRDAAKKSSEEDSLKGCTAKQQAILIARLVHPTASYSEISDRVGVASSYPSQVINPRQSLISQLETKIAQADNLADVIQEELDEESIVELEERGLLQNIDIDLSESVGEEEDNQNKMWGLPVKDNRVMSSSPSLDAPEDHNDVETVADRTNSDNNDSSTSTNGSEKESKSKQSVQKQIEQLRANVNFLRQIIEATEDYENTGIIALALQVEEELDRLLRMN